MARFRGALKYEVDWLGDGLYAHGLSDVTAAVDGDFRALFGASKLSNPDRPILKPLVGGVTLMGDDYAPRSSPAFTPSRATPAPPIPGVLVGRGGHRLSLHRLDSGAEASQEPRAGTKLTRYNLEGLTQQDLRRVVSLVTADRHDTSTVTARTLVEDAFGSALESYTFDPTALTLFPVRGCRRAQFVSQFGTVAGAFPMEHASGGYGLHSPLADPAGQVDIGTPDYVIAAT